MSSKLSATSVLYEKYKNENLIINMSYSSVNFDSYFVIIIEALTNNPKEFIDNLKTDINKYQIDIKTLKERKRILLII